MSLWEQMVIDERKIAAKQRNIRVCDLEEEETLRRAMENSIENAANPYLRYDIPANKSEKNLASMGGLSKSLSNLQLSKDEESDEDLEGFNDMQSCEDALLPTMKLEDNSADLYEGGPWLNLPQELTDEIHYFIGDADMVGYLRMTSKATFHPSEEVFKFLCGLIYPKQTAKKRLIVENWRKWENMLKYRPRVRTNGFYSLCTIATKPPCNDKFWEERLHKSVETRYFRHFRFFDDGRLLYSLGPTDEKEISGSMGAATCIPRKFCEGHYCICGKEIRVEVKLHYSYVYFTLVIRDGKDYYSNTGLSSGMRSNRNGNRKDFGDAEEYRGKFNTLQLVSHSSLPLSHTRGTSEGLEPYSSHTSVAQSMAFLANSQNLERERVHFELPLDDFFVFSRRWRFSSRQCLLGSTA